MSRVAIVTGGTRGIGEAISLALRDMGYTVAANYAGNEAKAQAFTEAPGIAAFKWDVGEHQACLDGCAAVTDALGPIDIVVNNAGITRDGVLAKMSFDDWNEVMRINLGGCFNMAKATFAGMRERGWGRIVNIGSINQLRPKAIVTAYAATKAAQHNIVQSQARDYARHGVLLNTLAPGLVDTDRNAGRKQADPDGWEAYVRDLNWMGRAGDPSEMVGAAIFLASNACSFMTGETVVLSGGY